MKRELYAHKDVGVVDIGELLRVFPMDDGCGLSRLDVKGFMEAKGEHEYDEPRLAHFRRSAHGLYQPLIVMIQKLGPKEIQLDIIDGWHRLLILHELGHKEFMAFVFPIEVVRRFMVDPGYFKGGEELQRFLRQR